MLHIGADLLLLAGAEVRDLNEIFHITFIFESTEKGNPSFRNGKMTLFSNV